MKTKTERNEREEIPYNLQLYKHMKWNNAAPIIVGQEEIASLASFAHLSRELIGFFESLRLEIILRRDLLPFHTKKKFSILA